MYFSNDFISPVRPSVHHVFYPHLKKSMHSVLFLLYFISKSNSIKITICYLCQILCIQSFLQSFHSTSINIYSHENYIIKCSEGQDFCVVHYCALLVIHRNTFFCESCLEKSMLYSSDRFNRTSNVFFLYSIVIH